MPYKKTWATIEERRVQVAKDWLARLPSRDTAKRLGVSHVTVCEDRKIILGAWADEYRGDYNELVGQELVRLEELERIVMVKAYARSKGQLFAVDRALAIIDQRSRLLGLYDKKGDGDLGDALAVIVKRLAGATE